MDVKHLIIFLMMCGLVYASCETGSDSSIEQYDITWTFDNEHQCGQFANGDYWVTGPVNIITINPSSTENNGRTMHGSMLNPIPGANQGYDSATYGYVDSLNVAKDVSSSNPLAISTSSLVSTISVSEAGARPQLQTAAILTILGSSPQQDSFRPAYCGNDKSIRFTETDVDYSLLKTLPRVADTPSMQDVENMFKRPWIDHKLDWTGRFIHPVDNMPDYGREIATNAGIGALMLHLDFSGLPDFTSNAEYKKNLLHDYIQLGIDNYAIVQNGGYWVNDGGHASGRKWPIIFAGLMLDDVDMKAIGERSGDYVDSGNYGDGNTPPDYIHFGEDDQVFYVSQDGVDMTHSTAWNPDDRAESLAYETSDIGLPEWGIRHSTDISRDNKFWGATYRLCCTALAWQGYILAAHIMDAKEFWNHDVIFDYMDRYMSVTLHAEPGWRTWNAFSETMWDTYRENFGCVWTPHSITDPYSQGSSACGSCSDGIQNQGETGIDCGGPCTACSQPPPPEQCTDADTNIDGLIQNTELLAFINNWKLGSVNIVQLMDAIDKWKNGC